jgi:hypothetical protein
VSKDSERTRHYRTIIPIDGVTIAVGDELDVRTTPGSPWVRRKFLGANHDASYIWCVPAAYSSSDASHWNGAFDVKWCVRLPETLDVIVKKINEP